MIIGGFGISHIFVDERRSGAPLAVIDNAKVQRPSACNALDSLLVHEKVAATLLPQLVDLMNERKVALVATSEAMPLLTGADSLRAAGPEDFDTEWLSLTLGVKLVADVNEALAHMREHNAGHSDAILTNDLANAERFVNGAGSAAVYVNASTRFTDGGQFGLGAEVAVSTDAACPWPHGADRAHQLQVGGIGGLSESRLTPFGACVKMPTQVGIFAFLACYQGLAYNYPARCGDILSAALATKREQIQG